LNDRAVIERAHAAKLDDAEWLLVEAETALHEENRPRTVEFDEQSDKDEKWRRHKERRRGENQIEQPFLDDFAARQRPARQLQARERAERGEPGLLEFVQHLFGAEMDLDRKREEGFGAAIDGFGRRPGQQQEDGVGLNAADAGDRLGEVAVENGPARFSGRSGDNRRQKAAADDVDAERLRLVPVDEGADMHAGPDQKDALRGQ
jgi:hypothetical protein